MIIPEYTPHGPDWFGHQRDHLEREAHLPAWALFWEQGTAKTKPVIDTICMLYLTGEIDGALIVAPPGVEMNWLTDELPKHANREVAAKSSAFVWQTSKKTTKWHKQGFEDMLSHRGLCWMMISYNAFITEDGKKAVRRFLRRKNTFYVLDESHAIKAPGAKRTKSIVASGVYAKYRRIMTGTPVANQPFDVYSQIKFLDASFWSRRDISTFAAFKNHFGVWELASDVRREQGYDPGYDKLLRYKNLDQLQEWLGDISSRVLKTDVLDLPPKLYKKKYFTIGKKARRLYDELSSEYIAQTESSSVVDGELPIVRMLRLQQIACGYVGVETIPDDDDEDENAGSFPERTLELIDERNERIQALREVLEETDGSFIIWARFIQDIDQIMSLLNEMKISAVRYDGTLKPDQALENRTRFQNGEVRGFVGTAAKGGPGLTLHVAKTVIYYSNSFKLVDRLQSEDRAHRAGMDDQHVIYVDIVDPDTNDSKIVKALVDKLDIASQITGDNILEWIR